MKPGICFTNESNARFAALPPNKQRVEIALDGIKLLEAGKIKAKRGRYFELSDGILYDAVKKNPDGSFQDTIRDFDMSSCEVCAKGLLFVTAIARRNRVTNKEAKTYIDGDGDSWQGRDMEKKLGGVFSAEQLRLIETEFEQRDVEYSGDWTTDQHIHPVMKLGGLASRERLIVILRNIVSNEGEFKPEAPSLETLALYSQEKLPRWHRPARETVTVVVTAEHAKKGNVSSNVHHPITLALHAAGLRRWTLWGVDFKVGREYRSMPPEAKKVMDVLDGDDWSALKFPVSFEVAVA